MIIATSKWAVRGIIGLVLALLTGQGATFIRAGTAAERAEKAMTIAEQSSQRIADLRTDLRQISAQLSAHDSAPGR